jgi:hypothetical protein
MHVRGMPFPGFAQPRPLAHMSPAQQTSPLAPQGSQLVAPPSPAWHERLARQPLSPPPEQQTSPWLPQATQEPPEQRAPDAVQVSKPPPPGPPPAPPAPPPQQVWPTAPQDVPPAVWHEPLEQVPLAPAPVHADPLATHVPPTQQPPL